MVKKNSPGGCKCCGPCDPDSRCGYCCDGTLANSLDVTIGGIAKDSDCDGCADDLNGIFVCTKTVNCRFEYAWAQLLWDQDCIDACAAAMWGIGAGVATELWHSVQAIFSQQSGGLGYRTHLDVDCYFQVRYTFPYPTALYAMFDYNWPWRSPFSRPENCTPVEPTLTQGYTYCCNSLSATCYVEKT